MKFELSQSFSFDAAHTLLRRVPIEEYQGSRRIHGHTYTAVVTILGERNPVSGMLRVRAPGKAVRFNDVDLSVLQKSLACAKLRLDHRLLDEVEGLGPATLENLCSFIADIVGKKLPVHAVLVSRPSGDSCRCVVTP